MTPGRPHPVGHAARHPAHHVLSLLLAVALAGALLAGSPNGGAPEAGVAGPARVLLAPSADREPVTPDLDEVPVPGTSQDGLSVDGARAGREGRALAALSDTEPVDGYAVAGATWRPDTAPEGMVVEVRTLDGGDWSPWEQVEVHDDHGPNPGSAEARRARDGSDAIVLGDVDEVQTRVTSPDGSAPEGLRLALVESEQVEADAPTEPAAIEGELSTVASSTSAPRPKIYSRAQWGADESLRSGSPSYGEIEGGFVHHTVNANGYSRAEVPGILRGIYTFHTQGRGWSDVGYNFLVDRFGRIWEGRYGGVSRPVVGAHTSGYNDDAFAMSAIGNFEEVRPSEDMLDAYGRLMAWKLGLHGVRAKARVSLDGRWFAAISGHRDAGSTACPGAYLYAKLGTIRGKAANRQGSGGSTRPAPKPPAAGDPHDLVGSSQSDLVVRDRRTGAVKVRAGGRGPGFGRQQRTSRVQRGADLVLGSPDLTGDRVSDLVVRSARSRYPYVLPGSRDGDFGRPGRRLTNFRSADILTAVGDMDRDGHNDLLARSGRTGRVYLHRGRGDGRFHPARRMLGDRSWWGWVVGAGDVDGDRLRDLVFLDQKGRLRLHRGNGRGGVRSPAPVLGTGWSGFDLVAGSVNFGLGRKADLVVRHKRSKRVRMYLLGRGGDVLARTGDWAGMGNLNRLSAVPDLTGDRRPDLVGRRGDGRIVVLAGRRDTWLQRPATTGAASREANLLMTAGDWDSDGREDVLVRPRSGRMQVWTGDDSGRLTGVAERWRGWHTLRHVVPVGDMDGDGYADLLGQDRYRKMWLYPGTGDARPGRRKPARSSMMRSDLALAAGRWDGDSARDLIVRRASDGALYLYPGNGSGGLSAPRRLGGGFGRYDRIIGRGDLDGDGHPDLVARERSTGFLWLIPGTPTGLRSRQYMAGAAPNLDLIG